MNDLNGTQTALVVGAAVVAAAVVTGLTIKFAHRILRNNRLNSGLVFEEVSDVDQKYSYNI